MSGFVAKYMGDAMLACLVKGLGYRGHASTTPEMLCGVPAHERSSHVRVSCRPGPGIGDPARRGRRSDRVGDAQQGDIMGETPNGGGTP
jgi:hypothetical protein